LIQIKQPETMKIKTFLLVLGLWLPAVLFSQRNPCGSDVHLRNRIAEFPGLQAEINRIFEQVATWIRNHPYDPHLHQISVSIPVVFHVLYKNAGENVAEAQIRRQVDITNAQLRKQGANFAATPDVFKRRAANCRVQLEFARRKPDGSATTGIERYDVAAWGRSTQYTLGADDAKKRSQNGVDAWDTNRYLNVWICDLAQWAGYATFPYSYPGNPESPSNLHGIVMAFGNIGSADHRAGATFTHELGHFLGLRHIWADANCGDDSVADTPGQAAPNNNTCPTFPKASTCSDADANGEMFQNFMDYSLCQTMFTIGQASRMWGFMNFSSRRAALLRSDAAVPPGALTRDYTVDFIPEYNNLPSWKAALAMVHGYVVSMCIPVDEINRLVSAGRSARGTRYQSLQADLADGIFGLGLTVEEVMACYTPTGFYNSVLNKGPVALVEVSGTSVYGLVVTGMQTSGSTSTVTINDPMDIGPRQIGLTVTMRGHEKIVNYNSFVAALEAAVIAGKKVYFVRPPHRVFP
jgi:Pregnancy-associated plasma protein-A/Papain-like cysteine protease AvrRpt2